jgi:DNA-binding NarL/FixJ family response regulator
MPPSPRPIRLAIANDYAIVVAGVASMLAEYDDSVVVVELDNRLSVLSTVDIVLFDAFAQVVGDGVNLADHLYENGAKVVVFTWSSHPESVARALRQGAAGYLSKGLTAGELVEAIEAIHDGEVVTSPHVEHGDARGEGDWPGRDAGLSPREAEMVAFIVKGLSNQEIADAAYLSINSVKTYVRNAYRKLGVERRPQAALWALQNGFAAEHDRVFDPVETEQHAVPPLSS